MTTKKKSNVLIVEDDLVNIEIYKEMLHDRYELLIAENGKKALEIMENQPADIVLLDILLPDYNGIDLCKIFKKNNTLLHIPIIIVTSLDCPEDKLKGLEAGANDFLTKPVDRTELLLKIKNHLITLEQYNLIKEQNEEINKYIGVMIHDLKNPLSVIMGYSELLEDFVEEEILGKYISKMKSSAEYMLDSINRILDIRKIERSSFDIKSEEFNLIQRIEEISSTWQVLAEDKRIRINLSLDPSIPNVIGDREQVKGIIDNLVSNAVKYSPPDTTIEIRSENLATGFTKIIVTDQGIGLLEDDKKGIFTGLKKSNKEPDGSKKVPGLGLVIVRRLVELMGGEVGVESEGENKGTSFWFTLKTPAFH